MNSLSTGNPLFEELDTKFRALLRSHGLVGTRHREMILKVLLGNTAPVTARDIHYQVKTANSAVSFNCVYQTMTLLVRSGLVKEIFQGMALHGSTLTILRLRNAVIRIVSARTAGL